MFKIFNYIYFKGQTNYQSLGCPPPKVKRTLFEQFNNSIEGIYYTHYTLIFYFVFFNYWC